jgi:hypothetical protein
MKNLKNKNIVTGKVDFSKVGHGHIPHQTGSGQHDHKCTKRQKTRQAILRKHLEN